MRALRVIGLAEDGSVICETEPASEGDKPERFTLKADDKLRAAARGDLPRLGQIEIELESQMRPREIQSRIRAGASVDEVAAAANMSPEKVDRFAYPVLLERSRTAELAQRAHPVRDDGPDVRTLGEVVANTFGQRGQDYTAVTWDSWRGEDGKWVVQLRWTAGRSDNRAHWTFHPGAHGGTVTVLDELATDLIDPILGKPPLRTVRPVTALAEQALQVDETQGRTDQGRTEDVRPELARADSARPELSRAELVRTEPRTDRTERTERTERTDRPEQRTELSRPEPRRQEPPRRPEPPQFEEPPAPVEAPAAEVDETPEPDEQTPEVVEATGTTEAAPTRRGGRNNRPVVPSWEDVLLGVRSNPNRG